MVLEVDDIGVEQDELEQLDKVMPDDEVHLLLIMDEGDEVVLVEYDEMVQHLLRVLLVLLFQIVFLELL